MAIAATQHIIVNADKNLVLKYTFGGTTGEAAAVKLVDLSALDANAGVSSLHLTKVQWALTGFDVLLLWDATTDVALIELSAGEGEQDYLSFGGIPNNAGTGVTGDVMYTTVGYVTGNAGHVILTFKKS